MQSCHSARARLVSSSSCASALVSCPARLAPSSRSARSSRSPFHLSAARLCCSHVSLMRSRTARAPAMSVMSPDRTLADPSSLPARCPCFPSVLSGNGPIRCSPAGRTYAAVPSCLPSALVIPDAPKYLSYGSIFAVAYGKIHVTPDEHIASGVRPAACAHPRFFCGGNVLYHLNSPLASHMTNWLVSDE